MDIKIKDLEKAEKEVKISLTPEEMDPYVEKAAQKLSEDLEVEGFRKGKVPRSVVEKELGQDSLWREAASEAIEESYIKAIEEKNVDTIGRPKVDILKLTPGNNFEFKVTVPVMPDLNLPEYKKIAKDVIEKEKNKKVEVDEKEVEEALLWLKRSQQNPEDSEGEKDSKILTPDDVNNKEDKKEDEKLTDEFAQSVGDFKNLQELKDNVREGIRKEKQGQEEQSVRLKVMEEIRKNTEIDLGETLIEQEMDKMQDEFTSQLESMDKTLEKYLEEAGQTLKSVREGWREKAKDRISTGILLRAIAEKEGIEAKEDEVEEEANKYLKQFENVEEAQKKINPEHLRMYMGGIIRNKKVFEFLEKQGEKNNEDKNNKSK